MTYLRELNQRFKMVANLQNNVRWIAMLLFSIIGMSNGLFAQSVGELRTKLERKIVDSLQSELGLTYAQYGNRQVQLDLYRPLNQSAPLPAIVCIHGGGWYKGERGNMTNLAQALAARGFVTVSISYRLSGEAKFPAAIQDCKAAVRWLRANATKYGIQADAIGATGLSAGGHLAALLATSGDVKELEGDGGNADHSSRIQACIAMGAQTDFESDRIRALSRQPEDPFYRPFLGGNAITVPGVYKLASPRHHIDRTDPPLAFMTGELDHESTHADDARRDLMKLGILTGLTIIPKAPHAFLNFQAPFDTCVDACDAFFTLHLKQHGTSSVLCDVPGLFAKDAKWRLLGGGYAGCEGAQWVDDTLYFAAHHDRLAFRWNKEAGLRVWRDDSPEASAFRPDGHGGFYVVEQATRRLVRWNAMGKETEVLANTYEGKKLNRPNDCIVHSDGSIWFSDPDFLFDKRQDEKKELTDQFVFRYDPKSKRLTAAGKGFGKPNGLAFSLDEKYLFVTDSSTPNIYRFSVNSDSTLSDRSIFANFDEKGLDGLAFDSAGRLWCCTKHGIRILTASGKNVGLLQTPGKPTSIAFGSDGRLCVTTRDASYLTFIRPQH